eukprot:CAMPEP_0196145814 /NCGR_PEP_ID=MMETSP0910-20130528/21367_1 /TAXON_ID=49265 /ORGANISM="Thalassiosira rotula, Strain GSO102" /LENGTH=111 /DNA_ID=CAMNT_0041407857 /DNA_START=694 /DNA_END=1030 /DNA_ORIENTATION=-
MKYTKAITNLSHASLLGALLRTWFAKVGNPEIGPTTYAATAYSCGLHPPQPAALAAIHVTAPAAATPVAGHAAPGTARNTAAVAQRAHAAEAAAAAHGYDRRTRGARLQRE